MIARLTSFSVPSRNAEEIKKIYAEECLPVIREQKGNLGAWLLEPANPADDFISLTEWITMSDAQTYENSGTYKLLVDKLIGKIDGKPLLRTYSIAEMKITTPA